MHIAVEGCAHGELDIIYKAVTQYQTDYDIKIELLICCGDFQAVRNTGDLKCMAVPQKYMQMQDFHEYYSGKKLAPILTIFIGGNHEASNHMQELPYGGWVAHNIYYLGYASVVKLGSLRIGGLSGIYKGSDFLKGHYEKSPYDDNSIRSVYHVRNLEAFRLKQLSGELDIFLSHDWPRCIYHHGDKRELIATKKHFESEINDNSLGSRPAEDILKKLKPRYWFSGHLHVKFAAILDHEDTEGKEGHQTRFLALDKCLPRREFLQILELDNDSEDLQLKHDEEWLTILRLTDHLLSTKNRIGYMPGPGYDGRYDFTPTQEEIEETKSKFGSLIISSSNFVINTDIHMPHEDHTNLSFLSMPDAKRNPQTEKFCSLLGMSDPMAILCEWKQTDTAASFLESSRNFNDSEMNVTLNTSGCIGKTTIYDTTNDDNSLASHDIIFELDTSSITSCLEGSPIQLLNVTPTNRKSIVPLSPKGNVDLGSKEEADEKMSVKHPYPGQVSGSRKIIRRNADQYSEE